MRKSRVKKSIAIAAALAMVQTNVVWCGVPALPLSSFLQPASPVFVFHASQFEVRPFDPLEHRIPSTHTRDRSIEAPTSQARHPVHSIGEIRHQALRETLHQTFSSRALNTATLGDFHGLPGVTRMQLRELKNAFGTEARVRFFTDNAGASVMHVEGNGRSTDLAFQPDGDVAIAAPASQAPPSQGSRGQAVLETHLAPVDIRASEQKLDGAVVNVGGQQVRLRYDSSSNQLIAFDRTGARVTEETKIFSGMMTDAQGNRTRVAYGAHHFELTQDGTLVVKGLARVEEGHVFKDGNVNQGGAAGDSGRNPLGPETHDLLVRVDESGQVFYQAAGKDNAVTFTAAVGREGGVDLGHATFEPVTVGASNIVLFQGNTQIASAGALGALSGGGETFHFSTWKVDGEMNEVGKAILNHFNISAGGSTLINKSGENVGHVSLDKDSQPRQVIVNSSDAGVEAGASLARSPELRAAGVAVGVSGVHGEAAVFFSDKVSSVADVRQTIGAASQLEGLSFSSASRPEIENAVRAIVAAAPGVARYETTVKVNFEGRTEDVRIAGGGVDAVGRVSTPSMISGNERLNEQLSLAHAENVRIPVSVGGRDIMIASDKDTGQLVPTDAQGNRITDASFRLATTDTAGKSVDLSYRIDSFEIADNGQLVAYGAADVAKGTELFSGRLDAPGGAGSAGGPLKVSESRHLDVTVQADNQIRFKATDAGARVSFAAAVGPAGIDAANVAFQPVGIGASDVTVHRADGSTLASVGAGTEIKGASGDAYRALTWKLQANPATATRDDQILRHFGIQDNAGVIASSKGIVVGRVIEGPGGDRLLTFQHGAEGDAAIKDIYFDQKSTYEPKSGKPETQVAWAGHQATVTLKPEATFETSKASLDAMDSFKLDRNTTQAQVDDRFKAIVGADHGIAGYDVMINAPGGAVRIVGQGAGADGEVRHPEIITDNPAFDKLAERRVESLADLGLPVKGAKIQGGPINTRIDAKTGQRKISGSGDEIRFTNAEGIIGSVNLENGTLKTLALYGGGAGGKVELTASGDLADRHMWVPAGQRVGIDLSTGKMSGTHNDVKTLNGVRVRFHDNDGLMIFRTDKKDPSRTMVDLKGAGLKTFAGAVKGDQFKGELLDGQVRFTAIDGLRNPLLLKQRIELPDAAGQVAAKAVLGNARIVRVDANIGAGAVTATGRSWIGGADKVYIPAGKAGAGGARPETALGADSGNLTVSTDANGLFVQGRGKDGGWLNVDLRSAAKPGGAIRAQATVLTSRAEHIETGAGGAVLDGKHFSAGVGINKTSDGTYRYTALKGGVTIQNGEGKGSDRITISKGGSSVYFENNYMLMANTAKHKDVAASLENVTRDFPGIGFTFKRKGDTVTPLRHKNGGDLKLFGEATDAMDLESTSGRIVDGRIQFDLKDDKFLRMNRKMKLSNGDRHARDLAVKQIAFDPASGEKLGVARIRVYEGERLAFDDKKPPKGGPRDRSEHNKASVSSINLGVETRGGKTYVTALGDSSYLSATLSDRGGKGVLMAKETIFSDHAKNLQIQGSGATVLGRRMDAGLTVNIGVASRGEFSVNGSALSAGESARVKLGRNASVELLRGSMLSFSDGKAQFSSSKGTIVLRQLAPGMRAPGLSVVGGLRNAVTTYHNGHVSSRHVPTYTYANRTGHAVPWRGMDVYAGTVFTPGSHGIRVHSGTIAETRSTSMPGVRARILLTSAGQSAPFLIDANGRRWTPPANPARNQTALTPGRHTIPYNGQNVSGTVFDHNGERLFRPDRGISTLERIYGTEFGFTRHGLDVRAGFAAADDKAHWGFGTERGSLKFARTGSFKLLGNEIQISDGGRGHQRIETHYAAANLNHIAINFSERGFHPTRIVYAPVGRATLRTDDGDVRHLVIPEKVLVGKDMDNTMRLGADHYAVASPTEAGTFTLSDKKSVGTGFVLQLGSELSVKDGAPTIPHGSIRIDRGMPGFHIGAMNALPVMQPEPVPSNANGTRQTPPAPPAPDILHYAIGAHDAVNITKGVIQIQDDHARLAEGTLLLRDGAAFKDPYFLGSVVKDGPGLTGHWFQTRQSFAGSQEEISKDIHEQVNGMKFPKGMLGASGDGVVPFAVVDRTGRRVGTDESNSHLEYEYIAVGAEGAPPARIETGDVYLQGGVVKFTPPPPQEVKEEVRGVDGKMHTVTHDEVKTVAYADDGHGGVRPINQEISESGWMTGNIHFMKDGKQESREVHVKLQQVRSRSVDEDGKPTDVTSSHWIASDGRQTRLLDLTQIHDLVEADSTVSDERKKEGVINRQGLNEKVKQMIETGQFTGSRPGRELNDILQDPVNTVISYGYKNDVHWGVTDFLVAATWGAGDYYLNGARNWDNVAKAMPAIGEIDTQNNPARAAAARLRAAPDSDGGIAKTYQDSKDLGLPFWRTADRFAGDILGFDRWINADKLYYIPLIAVEQGLTFASFGGIEFAKGGLASAKAAYYGVKTVQAAGAVEKVVESAKALTAAEKLGSVLWNGGKTVASKGTMLWLRHEAFGKAYGATDAWADAGVAGFTDKKVWGKTLDAAFNVALSEFPVVAPMAGGKLLANGGRAAQLAETLGFGKAVEGGLREGEVAWKQYATVAALGGGASWAHDALTGDIDVTHPMEDVGSVLKGATAASAALGLSHLTRAVSELPMVKGWAKGLERFAEKGPVQERIASALTGTATNARAMSVGIAGELAYHGVDNLERNRNPLDNWDQSVGQGAVIGFLGGRSMKAAANLPAVAAAQGEARTLKSVIDVASLDAYNLDRFSAGAGLAVTSTLMHVTEPYLSQIPVIGDAIRSMHENGLLAPEMRVKDNATFGETVAALANDAGQSMKFGIKYNPLFSFGTPARSVTEFLGLDAVAEKIGPVAHYLFNGPINMQMFAISERLGPVLEDKAGGIKLKRYADGSLHLDHSGNLQAENARDEGKLWLLGLAGKASAPAGSEPFEMRRLKNELSATSDSLTNRALDSAPLRWLTGGFRGAARDRAVFLAAQIQTAANAGRIGDSLSIVDQRGVSRTIPIRMRGDDAEATGQRGLQMVDQARSVLVGDARVQDAAMNAAPGEALPLTLAPLTPKGKPVQVTLDVEGVAQASVLGVRSLDAGRDRGRLEALANGAPSPIVAVEAARQLHGDDAATVFGARRALELGGTDTIVSRGLEGATLTRRADGDREFSTGQLPADHPLAEGGREGVVVIGKGGLRLEYRTTDVGTGVSEVTVRRGGAEPETYLEMSGTAAQVGGQELVEKLPSAIRDLIKSVGTLGNVTLRVKPGDADNGPTVIGLFAGSTKRATDFTERAAALDDAVTARNRWNSPRGLDEAGSLDAALHADKAYTGAVTDFLAAQIKFLSSGREPSPIDRIALGRLETAHLREAYRVAYALEMSQQKADDVAGEGLVHGEAVTHLRSALDFLVTQAKKNVGTAKGLNFLADASLIRDRVTAAIRTDKENETDLQKSFSEERGAAEEFYAVSAAQTNETSRPEAKTLIDAVSALLSENHLNFTGEDPIGPAKIAALDALMEKATTDLQRTAAIGVLFDGTTSVSDLKSGQRVALFIALATRYRETHGDSGPVSDTKVAANEGNRKGVSDKDALQAALLTQFMLGRVAGLSAGAGKTTVFAMGFADWFAKNASVKGVGELVVFNRGEIDKYVDEYQPLARALGIVFVNASDLASKTEKAWDAAYNPDKNERGEDWGASARLRKVAVIDFHSRGFVENAALASPTGKLSRLLSNVKVQAVDEADASLLSQTSFISSNGRAKATTSDVNKGRQIANAFLEKLGYNRPENVDLKADWIVTENAETPGYREFLPGTITDDDLNTGLWFHVKPTGEVVISRPLMEAVLASDRLKGLSVDPNEVKQVARAIQATNDSTRLMFLPESSKSDTLRPTLVTGGAPKEGQIDSSTMFNVAAVLLHNQRDGSRGHQESPKDDIRLSEAGSMATFVQVLQREMAHRFGATGTPESMAGLSEHVIGMRVVNVDPSTFFSYKMKTVDSVGESYANDRVTTTGGHSRELNFIVPEKTSSPSELADMQAEAIYLSQHDTSMPKGTIAGFVAAGRDAVHKLSIVRLLARSVDNEAAAGVIRDALTATAKNGGVSLRDFVNGLRSDGFKEALSNVSGASAAIVDDIVGRIAVIDGRDTGKLVQDTIVSRAGAEGLIVFVNELGLRGLSFDASKDAHEQVDLFMSGFDNFTKDSWLQAVARVDRKTVGARRTVVLDGAVLDAHLTEALAVDGQLRSDGREGGIFGGARDSESRSLSARLKDFGQHPETFTKHERLELASEYLSRDNQARSALFFISEQTSVQLLKQPLQQMVARERAAGNEKGAQFLDQVYHDALAHSDKGPATEGTGLQDYRKIAADAFNGSAETAARFLIYVAEKGKENGVSDGMVQEARLCARDVVNAMDHVGEEMRSPTPWQEHIHTFVEVNPSISGRSPARDVLAVVAQLADRFILSNTALSGAEAHPMTAASYEAQVRRANPAEAASASKSAIALALPASAADAPRSAHPSEAQRTAAASIAIYDYAHGASDVAPALASIVPAASAAPTTHPGQAAFLSTFQNPRAALALASVLSGYGLTLSEEKAKRLLESSSPGPALAEFLIDQGKGGDALKIAAKAMQADIARTAMRTYIDVKADGGSFVSAVSPVRAIIDNVTGRNKTAADVMARTPLSALGGESDRIATVVALYLMLHPGEAPDALLVGRRLAGANTEVAAKATVGDVSILADASIPDDLAVARFELRAGEPSQVSESAWYKPVIAAGTALGAIGAGAAMLGGLAPAIPGLASVSHLGGFAAHGLSHAGGSIVAGALISPILQLLTGTSMADMKTPAGSDAKAPAAPNWIAMGVTALTLLGTVIAGPALASHFQDGVPGALPLASVSASVTSAVLGATALKNEDGRAKAFVSLLMVLGAAGIALLPGTSTMLGAASSSLGNIASGAVETVVGSAIGGGLAFAAGWALLNGPAQWIAKARNSTNPEVKSNAETSVRLGDKAKEILSRFQKDGAHAGAATMGDLWEAIQDDDTIAPGEKMTVFRFALIGHGLSEAQADQACRCQQDGDEEAGALASFTLDDVLYAGTDLEAMVAIRAFEQSWGFDDSPAAPSDGSSDFQIPADVASTAADLYVGAAAPAETRAAFINLWSDFVSFGRSVTPPEKRADLPALSFADLTDRAYNGTLHEAYAQVVAAAAPDSSLADKACAIAARQSRVLNAVARSLVDGGAAPEAVGRLMMKVQGSSGWTPELDGMIHDLGGAPDNRDAAAFILASIYFTPAYLGLTAASGERPATRPEMRQLAQVWHTGGGAAEPIPHWDEASPLFRAATMIEPGAAPRAHVDGEGRNAVITLLWKSDGQPDLVAQVARSGDNAVATVQTQDLSPSEVAQVVFGFTPQTAATGKFDSVTVARLPAGWTILSADAAGAAHPVATDGGLVAIDNASPGFQLIAPPAHAAGEPRTLTFINPAFTPPQTPGDGDAEAAAFDGTAADVPEEPAFASPHLAAPAVSSSADGTPRGRTAALPTANGAVPPISPLNAPALPPAIADLVASVASVVEPIPSVHGAVTAATPEALRARALEAAVASQGVPARAENGTLAFRPAANGQPETVYVRLPAGWVELTPTEPRWVVTPSDPETQFYVPSAAEPQDISAAAPAPDKERSGVVGFLQRTFNLPSLLIIGSLGLLSAPTTAAAAGLADAPVAGAAVNPVSVTLSLVGVRLALGLTVSAIQSFRSTKASDQREDASVRAPHPFVVPVPTENGRRAIRFSSDQPFEREFFAAPGDTRERIFARTAQTSSNGETVIGQGRELRFVTLVAGPTRPTPAIRELDAALSAAAVAKAPVYGKSADASADVAVAKILGSAVIGGWAKNIDLAPLLEDADIPADARAALDALGEHPTLGQVAALADAPELKTFVYQLVLHNAEAVASPAGILVSADTLKRISEELNAPLIVHHTHPQSSAASYADRVTAHSLYAWGGDRGVISPLPSLISNQNELTFYDDAKDVLLTMSARKEILAVRPVDAPFQSLQIGPAALGEPSGQPGLWSRLRAWIVSGFKKNENLGLFPAEMGGERDRLVARAGLELAYALHTRDLAPDQMRRVWGAVADNVFSPVSESDIAHALADDDKLAGLDLAALIRQLSAQIRAAYAPGNAGGVNMAGAGHLPDIGLAVNQYLSVAALPASLDGPEAEWMLREVGRTLDLKLISADQAERRAAVVRERLRSAPDGQLTSTLLALAGLTRSDFLKRLEAASTGGFTTQSDVAAVLSGKSGDAAARSAAIGILVQPVAQALAAASGLKIDAGTARLLDGLRVELVTPAQADPRVTHRSAGLLKDGGSYRVQIVLEENLGAEEALATAVGRLAHELAHILAHPALVDLSIDGLGIPTLAEESWVGLSVSRGLRWMGLGHLADAVELETLEAIVDMRNAQAFYVVYDDVKGNKESIAALVDRVRATRGLTRIVVLAKPADVVRATRDLGPQGLHVVSTRSLLGLRPSGQESRLETHARLYLGTTRVRLVLRREKGGGQALASPRYLDLQDILLRAGGRPAVDLIEEIASEGMAESLRSILQRQITAAKQA